MGGRRRTRRDRGAAAVEFALVLPVLLLIIFGIVDMGRMLYTKITLTQAAAAAARAAAIGGQSDGESQAHKASAGLDQTALNVAVTPCPDPAPHGSDATATLTYHFKFVTPLAVLANFGGNNIDLASSSQSPCLD